jgi:hypothetical protein
MFHDVQGQIESSYLMSYDVFLSYSSRDREQVARVADCLRADGVQVWFDQFVLGPGAHIPTAIEEGLERSRKVAVFLSGNALASNWVAVERYAFLMDDPRSLAGRFLPVLLEKCELPHVLRAFRAILYYQDPSEGYRELLAAIRRIAPASPTEKAVPGDRPGAVRPELARRARQFSRLACPAYLQSAWRSVIGVARGG